MSRAGLRAVQIQVAGQTLALRTDSTPAYLRELAAMVDTRLAEVRDRHVTEPGRRVVSTQALALLCALQLADELLQATTRERALRDDVRARVERILQHLTVLAEDAPPPRRPRRGRASAGASP